MPPPLESRVLPCFLLSPGMPCPAYPGRPGVKPKVWLCLLWLLSAANWHCFLPPAAASPLPQPPPAPACYEGKRFKTMRNSGCAPEAAPWGLLGCQPLQTFGVIPTPHSPDVRKDQHVQDPLNASIIHALDPEDFVCLILENAFPVAAG